MKKLYIISENPESVISGLFSLSNHDVEQVTFRTTSNNIIKFTGNVHFLNNEFTKAVCESGNIRYIAHINKYIIETEEG